MRNQLRITNHMWFLKDYITLFIISILFIACGTSKHLPYFTDLPQDRAVAQLKTLPYVPLKLQVNDELQITITSSSPEASQIFNLMTNSPGLPREGSGTYPQSGGYINGYRVLPTGIISMPVLGAVKAAGLTMEELSDSITQRLKPYLKDAVVSMTLTNFKVTVIGEVNKPVVIPVSGQNINVLEAIGAAGDLTVYGIRQNVKVIHRLADGTTEVATLNLNKAASMQSQYFQLRQNDVVYVQPNRNKGITGNKSAVWVPILSSIFYIAAIIVSNNL